jgi:thioredoxin 2
MSAELVVCGSCSTANRVPTKRLAAGPKCGRCGKPLFGNGPIAADSALFSRLVGTGTLPVLADFWASWCGPCRAMAPEFERAAAMLEPEARLVKVNVDEEPALAQKFQTRSIPTILIALHGRELARVAGARSAAQLVEWVRREISRVSAASA